MRTGSCLCGAVAFHFDADAPAPSVCHCGQCRRQSGHVWASTFIAETALVFDRDDSLRWFRSSDAARRGFCSTCGSFLFWKHDAEDTISIAMGALDAPTGLTLGRHIFVADKGDYYTITDDLPQT
ncbi:GFA family protein [Aestuariivita sp.]|jgi:hypothetical protein|uniref:GFA family protein n=1 Tax=Aestuariivita sp. TaxID=1872407 RepID=UPI002170FF26|nr:GFA family protein [Aestuariivita sp.]MCE8007218.1 GFA family protein [Aestuariivita sp.]